MLPAKVLKQAQQELRDWASWQSVMEVSHRGKEFIQVAEEAEKDFRDSNVPSNYKVLFCHGGGRGQFARGTAIFSAIKPPQIMLMPVTGRQVPLKKRKNTAR